VLRGPVAALGYHGHVSGLSEPRAQCRAKCVCACPACSCQALHGLGHAWQGPHAGRPRKKARTLAAPAWRLGRPSLRAFPVASAPLRARGACAQAAELFLVLRNQATDEHLTTAVQRPIECFNRVVGIRISGWSSGGRLPVPLHARGGVQGAGYPEACDAVEAAARALQRRHELLLCDLVARHQEELGGLRDMSATRACRRCRKRTDEYDCVTAPVGRAPTLDTSLLLLF